jgi:hypothetical protein
MTGFLWTATAIETPAGVDALTMVFTVHMTA